MDVERIRQDFPIFERKIGSKPLVYLDNAATSQKPIQVIEAITSYYTDSNANVHRGSHTLSNEASALWEGARETIGRFINAGADDLIFTRNATESLNLVAYTLFQSVLKPGDEILTTRMEHHSNLVPWQQLALLKDVKVHYVRVTPEGLLDEDDFRKILARGVKVAAFTQCSNILGTITPVEKLTRLAKEAGAIVVVDGCQAAPHMSVDVKAIGCDFYAFSGHKMLGPTGIGVLWGHSSILEQIPPFLFGGDMISTVCLESTTFNTVPRKFEAGTPNIAGGIGLGAAVKYLERIGMDNIRAHEKELLGYAVQQLKEVPGVIFYGTPDIERRSGVLSFNLEGIHPHDVAQILDTRGIAVRSGDHCGQPLMNELGIKGGVRASFYLYNTIEEVDALIEGLHAVRKLFG